MSLSLRQLQYFVAIADAGGLSRASEALSIAQSALSLHISDAETFLGVRLFERRPRGMVLTPAGQRLYDHARAMLALAARAELDLRSFNETAHGPVTLGLAHTAEAMAALPIMQRVGARWPDIHLTLSEGLSPKLIDRVLAGEIDIAVAYNPVDDSRLTREPLLDEDIVLVGRSEIIGSGAAPVAFADIPQGMVLGLNPVPASRSIIEAQILRRQIVPNPRLEINSLSSMKKALIAGLGCALIARATVAPELAGGVLNARPIIEPALGRTLYIVSLADHPKTRAFIAVRDVVREAIGAEVDSGEWPTQRR